MCGCRIPKRFIAMAYDSKSHVIILWCKISMKLSIGEKLTGLEILILCVISMKLNIGEKLTRLEILTLNHKNNLACFKTYRTDDKGV